MLGAEIRRYLDRRGLRYAAVARQAELAPCDFRNMLLESRPIKAEEYLAICRALGLRPEAFDRRGGYEDKEG